MVCPKVNFHSVPWDEDAAARIGSIAGHDAAEVQEFCAGIENRLFHLVEMHDGCARIGVAVFSIQTTPCGNRTLIIHAAQADAKQGRDIVAVIHEKFRKLGRFSKCVELVIWTQRDGLARKLSKLGLTPRYVFEESL